MICVSIGRGRLKDLIAGHKQLVEEGAKLVELRIDFIEGPIDLKALLKDRPGPVVITCRREKDGGRYTGSEPDRLLLIRSAIAEGADYVDLEEDVAGGIPRFGATRRIVSLHDYRRTPADLPAIHQRLKALDADIVKIATMAHHPHDNLRMLELIRQSDVPTVGLCMGDIGTPSRILGRRFGAPFTFATFHAERRMAPGQLTFREMRELYRYDTIDAQTEIYGVIGDPIVHSYSPLLHNAAFEHYNLNKVYLPFRVPPETVVDFLKDAPQLGIRGLSVTIPHKEAVIPCLTEAASEVDEVGAANTILFEGDRLLGYNTDISAAIESLEEEMRPVGQEKSPLDGKTVLVLGAGGAAKAIAHGLKRRGAEIIIANRSKERAMELAHRLKCRAIDWDARGSTKCTVLINCTPLGMHPNVNVSPYEKNQLKPSMVVFDTVYNPENTLLIKYARLQNCKVVSGRDMFVRQAALQFKLFTGLPAPEELMRDVLRRAIAPAKV